MREIVKNSATFLTGLIIVVLITTCLIMPFSRLLSTLHTETSKNNKQVEQIKQYQNDLTALDELAKTTNYKYEDVATALPAALLQEKLLLDVYRAKYAVTDFNRASLKVDFPNAENTQIAQLSFNGSYAQIKNYILELEKSPRTYQISSLNIAKNAADLTCTLMISAYSAENPNEATIEASEDEWFSPSRIGKTDLFTTVNTITESELNSKIFDGATPSSYYKDFLLTINSQDAKMPAVSFQQYKGYNSTISGENYDIELTIIQSGNSYYYSYKVGTEVYPAEGEAEILLHKNKDIVISVIDDCDVVDVPRLKTVNLNINNKTDKLVRITGKTNKRLSVSGTGYVKE